MTSDTSGHLLRPLGAFERTIDLYMHRNPVQFSLTVSFGRTVSEDDLAAALRELQRVHPLLAVAVDRENDGPGAAFGQSDEVIPVRVAHGTTWQHEAAAEQVIAIEPSPGPLVRAVLLDSDDPLDGSTIIVTFAHQIADGSGALRTVADLASLLAGDALTPSDLPTALEDLLTGHVPADDMPAADVPVPDPGAMPPPAGRLRPFDGARPVLQTNDLDVDATRLLLERARAESCTVQAALCAAAATVISSASGQDEVRINVPIDLRRAADLDDDVVVRFGATTILLTDPATTPFWDLARTATEQLETARAPEAVRAAASMLAALAPTTSEEAEALMLTATAADIEITNLGVTAGALVQNGVTAVWGPTMTTQVVDEQILGVATHGGVLRLVNVTHDPIDGLVDGIRQVLEDMAQQSRRAGQDRPA